MLWKPSCASLPDTWGKPVPQTDPKMRKMVPENET
jgi:hypothetical protein